MPRVQWQLRPLPENPVRDDRGFVIEPLPNTDLNTWQGRFIRRLAEVNERDAETQRRLGYQVYPGDPGRHPYIMSDYEQGQAMRETCGSCFALDTIGSVFKQCTIL
jgi:hypothetical protein